MSIENCNNIKSSSCGVFRTKIVEVSNYIDGKNERICDNCVRNVYNTHG